MENTRFWKKISYWKKILCRQEIYFPRQIKAKYDWVGSEYGGFYVGRGLLTKDSIVYSFGVGEDVTFDLELIKRYGLNVYAFDPTPLAIKFVEKENLSTQFHFESIGISDKDETALFYLSTDERDISGSIIDKNDNADTIQVEMKKTSSIMKELNHSHIDLLKMDIEGSEYAVLENILEEKIFPKQLCVEFHHRFPQIGLNQTKDIVRKLNNFGYKIAKISDFGLEYTFLLSR
jgi:FkbM family methyltransferase